MSNATQQARLVNGVGLSGPKAGQLQLDANDPMAVLALKLVADGTGSVRQRAAARGALLKRLESLLESPSEIAPFQRPEAVVGRLQELAKAVQSADRDLAAGNQRLKAQQSELEQSQRAAEALTASRAAHSSLLWWFGIGWLVWKFTGKQAALDAAVAQVREQELALARLTAERDKLAALVQRCREQTRILEEVATIDGQPVELMRRFGWSHVPFVVTPGVTESERLIFTNIWVRNFAHDLPDIENGIERVDALRRQILPTSGLPILLSPDTDQSAEMSDLIGEELQLARNIGTFASLAASASRQHVEASLLPADAAIDQQMGAWVTDVPIGTSAAFCVSPPDPQKVDDLVSMVARVNREIADPEQDLAERLKGVAVSLRDRTQDFADKRSESIEGMMGSILSEWSGWSMLPLRRRYCPSFHFAPNFRYHRLGFTLDDAFDADSGEFRHVDKLDRLPNRSPIDHKLKVYEERRQDNGGSAKNLEAEQAEILHLIRLQVDGAKIVGLSASARLHYSRDKGCWECGLCEHEPRIAGPLGCPKSGRFSEEEARMAEQYVQYEDLLIPMLSALWNEKSTHDEVHRILRDKEAELRRNVLEEQQALRSEGQFFKEAARDRIVKLEDVAGNVHELVAKFGEEVRSANAMGAVDGSRRFELEQEVQGYQHKLSEMAGIAAKVKNHEDNLVREVDQTLERREVQLEERVRRSSDAPRFVYVPPDYRHSLITTERRLIQGVVSPAPIGDDHLLLRQPGDRNFVRKPIGELFEWLDTAGNLGAAATYEASDASGGWIPLLDHPRVRTGLPTLPTQSEWQSAQAVQGPPTTSPNPLPTLPTDE